MSDFKKFLPILLKNEGLYTDNPSDPGNSIRDKNGQIIGTNYGITAQTYHDYSGDWLSKDQMKTLDIEVAEEIYKLNYWNKTNFYLIENQDIANIIADHYVNSGKSAIELAKERLWLMGNDVELNTANDHLSLHNIATLNGINQRQQDVFFNSYRDDRINYYESLDKEDLIKGWLNRVDIPEFAPKIILDQTSNTSFTTENIQYELQKQGFLNDNVDGHLGPKTFEALKEFQVANGILATGVLDEITKSLFSEISKNEGSNFYEDIHELNHHSDEANMAFPKEITSHNGKTLVQEVSSTESAQRSIYDDELNTDFLNFGTSLKSLDPSLDFDTKNNEFTDSTQNKFLSLQPVGSSSFIDLGKDLKALEFNNGFEDVKDGGVDYVNIMRSAFEGNQKFGLELNNNFNFSTDLQTAPINSEKNYFENDFYINSNDLQNDFSSPSPIQYASVEIEKDLNALETPEKAVDSGFEDVNISENLNDYNEINISEDFSSEVYSADNGVSDTGSGDS